MIFFEEEQGREGEREKREKKRELERKEKEDERKGDGEGKEMNSKLLSNFPRVGVSGWTWWCMTIIPATRRLGMMVNSGPG